MFDRIAKDSKKLLAKSPEKTCVRKDSGLRIELKLFRMRF